MDLESYPWTARLFVLLVFLVLAAIVPRMMIYPERYRHGVSLHEYVSAFRSARWFGREAGPVLRLVSALIVAGVGVVFAFPELFWQ